MSLLWRDEVGIHLSSNLVVLTRMKRGLRPQRVAHEVMPVERPNQGMDSALRALDTALEFVRWHDANARIVVADSCVRYAIVPRAERLNSSERHVHAWHVMEQAYGEMQAEWRLAFESGGSGQPGLACAMPTLLHDSVMESCRKARLRVRSLQPQLVVAYNCAGIGAAAGWFVSLASGSLSAAQFGPRGWTQVRSLRVGDDWSAELQRLRKFGQLTAQSTDDARVFVDAPVWLQRMIGSDMEGLEILAAREEAASAGTLQSLVSLRALHP